MKLIVAVAEDWGIGKDNRLLFSLKEDMKFFRETTTGHTVVMGKNTFKSFPNGKLKNRINVILTREKIEDCVCVPSLDALFDLDLNDAFVIGGASVYKQLLPYCEQALITKVHASREADTFFPNLDEDADWECVKAVDVEDTLPITFCVYVNKNIKRYHK